jgi:hypothetical protein
MRWVGIDPDRLEEEDGVVGVVRAVEGNKGVCSCQAALYAVTGWEDSLSFQEWRLTGTYLFGFTTPTFLSAGTEKERLSFCGKQPDEGGHHVQCCAKQTRGAWLVGHNAVQAVWKQAGEEAGFIAQFDAVQGLSREFLHHRQDLRYSLHSRSSESAGLTPILADISMTHPFVGNAVNREQGATYQGKGLCHKVQMKRLKHAWAKSDHTVVPCVSDALGSMTGESAVTLCQAVQEMECFVEDWGDGAGADNGNSALVEASKPMGCAPGISCLASDSGVGHRPRCPRRQKLEVPQERGCHFPRDGGVCASVLFYNNGLCVRKNGS